MKKVSTRDIRRALRGALNTTEKNGLERARIGKRVPGGMITDVPNLPGKVYIRLFRNGGVSLTTAINRGAPLRANPDPTEDHENDVWVKLDPKTASFIIERRVEIIDSDQPVKSLTVPRHRHNIGSGNEDPVEGLRFLPGLVHKRQQDSLIVKVREFTYKTATGYAKFSTTTFDLTPYLPSTSNTHAYVIVGFDPATEAIVAVTGTEYATTTTLTYAHIEEIAFSYIPLAAVKLKAGQTISPDYRDFVDLREWFSSVLPIVYAPTSAKYWVSEASAALSAEIDMSTLGDGVLYQTSLGGVATPAIATPSQLATAMVGAAGGANQVVKRATTTGAFSVGALVNGDIPTTLTSKTLSSGSLTSETVTDTLTFTENGGAISNPANTAVKVYAVDGNSRSYVNLLDSTGLVTIWGETVKVLARNETGSTINKGKVVRISGVGSALPLMTLAIADTVSNAEGILAVVMEDIANNANGFVMLHGRITMDTSALSTGDAYVSGSSAGNIVTSAPTIARKVGVILSAAASGLLYFSPQPVSVSSPAAIGAAPKSAGYITKTADSDLTNEFALGSLATGLLHNTNTTGIPTVITGTNTGDLVRWNGSAAAFARASFGEMSEHQVLPPGGAASISLTNLSTLNGNFDHLLLVLRLRSNRAAQSLDGLGVRFNNDSAAANYASVTSETKHGNTLTTSEQLVGVFGGGLLWSAMPAAAASGSFFSTVNIFIPDYREVVYKICQFDMFVPFGTSSGQMLRMTGGFIWLSGSAIASISLFPQLGTAFVADSSYALYGIGPG